MGDGGILGGRMRAWLHALSSASGTVAGLGDQVAVKGESSKFLPTELERSRTTDREGQRRLGSKATILDGTCGYSAAALDRFCAISNVFERAQAIPCPPFRVS